MKAGAEVSAFIFSASPYFSLSSTEKFLIQKLEYIHANPISGKWQLANTLDQYQHSSARFYELNEEHRKVKIIHHKDLGG